MVLSPKALKRSTKILLANLSLQVVVAVDLLFLNPSAIYAEVAVVTLAGFVAYVVWKKGG